MPVARLEDRSVIAISGQDARSFLQGLITNDIQRLKPGVGIYAALLTPQGKILFDFFLIEGDGAILVDCATSTCEALIKRLCLYKLRAKVTIEPRDQLAVLAEWDKDTTPYAIVYQDPRVAELGRRAIVSKGEMGAHTSGESLYREHRLSFGVPENGDFGSDFMFALDADLDELHGVDFDKGCYVGQELTARMKHRAKARKRLLTADCDGILPPPHTPVRAGDKDVGEITSAYGKRGFALVRLDRLDEMGQVLLSAGDSITVKLSKPSWLST